MSPRRSSRARSSQQPPIPSHSNSSTSVSSNTTIKGDQNLSNVNSNTQPSQNRSESVDDADSMSRANQAAPRRSRRGAEAEKDMPIQQAPEDEEEEEEGIEEEVTRCICGHADYPGPGASVREQLPNNLPVSDDIGNFFVQCDNCHVWQHGGCMGLTDESMLPDEYYCEQCKPEFHKIIKGPNSTKTSRYLPILEASSRSTPLPTVDQVRGKDAKNKALQSTRRRATMNSRGAYDEDEALRRAIEESKAEGTLGKRGREDSEDRRHIVKRQRTGSTASSGSRALSQSPDGTHDPSRPSNKNSSKLRGAAARNNREKEMRDKQKQEAAAQRAEAANKRNARSERRRGDESPPPTPTLSPSKAAQAMATGQRSKPETPPMGKATLNRKAMNRATVVRGRRGGRNQYTRDSAQNGDISDTPHRDTSHDRNGSGSSPQGANGVNGESGRSSKARTHPARTSLNEMKKRVAAILEFVGQMQTQQPKGVSSNGSSDTSSTKGNSTPNGTSSATVQGALLPTSSLVQAVAAGLEEVGKQVNGQDGEEGPTKIKLLDELDFGKMGSHEMMETLTKELVQWQTVYGVYTR